MADKISIHAPRAGGDRVEPERQTGIADFNPRPPCGGRPLSGRRWPRRWRFQSTPPVRGATCAASTLPAPPTDFNPRPPCGGRPGREKRAAAHIQISIHAPRAGGDAPTATANTLTADFNPRPPCGGRLLKFESLFGFSNNSCMVIRFLAAPSSLL